MVSGGTVEVASGASVNQVGFAAAASGTLILDSGAAFTGVVSGFGLPDKIELAGIPYNSGVTGFSFTEAGNNQSGTLIVSSGSVSATLTLLGQYTSSQFNLTSGASGTFVTDPPVQATLASTVAGGGEIAAGGGAAGGNDTVVGFSPGGDRVQPPPGPSGTVLAHSTPAGAGDGMLLTLADGSTILIKGAHNLNNGFLG